MMSSVLTVSQINSYIKSVVDYDGNLKNIYICGEISNFTNHYRSGHFYFTLKDNNSSIKAVMFKSSASRVRFEVEDGMRVIIRGSISVFERDGVYQLYCDDMQPDGVGALNLAYEQLKKKLSSLGLFDEENKKPLPLFPDKIGVITSPTGAAVHDITTVLSRRYPLAQIVFEPVAVQGENAAPQIVKALEKFNLLKGADVIILGRGGGSIEDLWAFNEEEVAYAVFKSKIPVVSAVGHETDFTICDFVSDKRAATPSAAAEIVAPDIRDLFYTVNSFSQIFKKSIDSKITDYTLTVSNYEKLIEKNSPISVIDSSFSNVKAYQERISKSLDKLLSLYEQKLSSHSQILDALSPLKIISKGYAIVYDQEGKTISSAENVQENSKLNLRLADGVLHCDVKSKEKL